MAPAADTSKVPKTVLLADDSVAIHRIAQLTFANSDVTVVSARDGREAIEAIDRSAPDLVLADVDMPEGNGYQVAEYVRSRPDLASIPVLLLAGAFDPADVDEAQRAGVARYFESRAGAGPAPHGG